jgi:hypothetical protein
MLNAKKLTGLALATAAAGLFAAAGVATTAVAADAAKVKCEGINACKGQGKCAQSSHSCAGQNSCKGKGWVEASEKECKDKGGKVVTETK